MRRKWNTETSKDLETSNTETSKDLETWSPLNLEYMWTKLESNRDKGKQKTKRKIQLKT